MPRAKFLLEKDEPKVVGSFGSLSDLRSATALSVGNSCDLAEIRLDLLGVDEAQVDPSLWHHLTGIPLLFTARRIEEGGAQALPAAQRMKLLEAALDDAAAIDIEVASIREMAGILEDIRRRGIPWIASYHDFEKLPDITLLEEAARRAREAGASAFKAAARMSSPADLARLAEFQLADHGILVATMGMGPLAPVSRLLCAQCGSVLNYGYLGETATAPGQWDSALLQTAIGRLTAFRS